MIIYEFRINTDEVVKIKIEDFKGRQYLDVRKWRQPETPSKAANEEDFEGRPTHRGIRLSMDHAPDLIAACDKIKEFISKKRKWRK